MSNKGKAPWKRFNLLKKKNKGATPLEFDENTFDFRLKGGPYQSVLIEASATIKKGDNIGMPLPLQCTWYRANTEADFIVIEGVTGAFYQPSIDDVGCKICVHAIPVSEVEEYTGMPAFAELKPLELDPDTKISIRIIDIDMDFDI